MLPDFDDEFAGNSEYITLYRQLKLQVVPALLPSQAKNWKRPALNTWKQHTHELADEETFNEWIRSRGNPENGNLGIITGLCSGGVFIVDLDTYKDANAQVWWDGICADHNCGIMLEAPTQRTGGGGLQMLFRAPRGWTPPTIKTSIGVDIRGQGRSEEHTSELQSH